MLCLQPPARSLPSSKPRVTVRVPEMQHWPCLANRETPSKWPLSSAPNAVRSPPRPLPDLHISVLRPEFAIADNLAQGTWLIIITLEIPLAPHVCCFRMRCTETELGAHLIVHFPHRDTHLATKRNRLQHPSASRAGGSSATCASTTTAGLGTPDLMRSSGSPTWAWMNSRPGLY
jgi:hypothetical protein